MALPKTAVAELSGLTTWIMTGGSVAYRALQNMRTVLVA